MREISPNSESPFLYADLFFQYGRVLGRGRQRRVVFLCSFFPPDMPVAGVQNGERSGPRMPIAPLTLPLWRLMRDVGVSGAAGPRKHQGCMNLTNRRDPKVQVALLHWHFPERVLFLNLPNQRIKHRAQKSNPRPAVLWPVLGASLAY